MQNGENETKTLLRLLVLLLVQPQTVLNSPKIGKDFFLTPLVSSSSPFWPRVPYASFIKLLYRSVIPCSAAHEGGEAHGSEVGVQRGGQEGIAVLVLGQQHRGQHVHHRRRYR